VALKEGEETIRKYLDFAGILFIALTKDQTISLANRRACEILGYEEHELLGKNWFDTVVAEIDRERIRAAFAAIAAGEGNNIDFKENTLWTKRGDPRIIEWHTTTLSDANGSVSCYLCAGTDITDYRNSERILKKYEKKLRQITLELKELNSNLEKRVREEIQRRRQQELMLIQQSKMASMGEMIEAIAHQWKQPLNAMGLIVQDIGESYALGVPDKNYIDRTISGAMEQIYFMSRTIDDFRNFFKTSKGKKEFDVLNAIKNIFTIISTQLKVSSIQWQVTCRMCGATMQETGEGEHCRELMVHAYENEFKQVILNILSNATDSILLRRARSEDEERQEKGEISVECVNESGMVRVQVSDNGTGIPEKLLDRIFEPYFTTKEGSGGTGIGLYMAKVIIEENMGGRIYAKNTEDGARITVELHAAE
jgi:PAS domain S-box-containing protein